jgi:hypothetical protein
MPLAHFNIVKRRPVARRKAIAAAPATVRGYYSWHLYEPDGVTPYAAEVLDRHGESIGRQVAGSEKPNVITNAGLDAIGTANLWQLTNGPSNSFRTRLAIGTGSTPPTVTDTGLQAEVQRAAVNVGGGNATTAFVSGDTVLRVTQAAWLRVTTLAPYNLTEFGLTSGGGILNDTPIYIRQLFRDELDNPITISLVADKIIEVRHTLLTDIAMPTLGTVGTLDIEEYDAADILINTINADIAYGFVSPGLAKTSGIMRAWHPNPYSITGTGSPTVPAITSDTPFANNAVFTLSGSAPNPTTQAYVGGSYERLKTAQATVDQLNALSYGWLFNGGGAAASTFDNGFVIRLVTPNSFEKLNTHTLSLGYKSTWARG